MRNTRPRRTIRAIPGLGALAALAFLLAAPADAGHDELTSYSYPSILEGRAELTGGDGQRADVDRNQPILVGDRLYLPWGSRLEVVLADRSLLRLEGESYLAFEAIAYSADADDRETVLYLDQGELQLVVGDHVLGEVLPRIETPEATIYVDRPGSFRVSVDRSGDTRLVVREGAAELVSAAGSQRVYAGDLARLEGGYHPRLRIARAGYPDGLERWGDELSVAAARASVPYVEAPLRYAAAPLAHHGSWVSVGGRHGWRPRVEVSWRPYGHGYWRHTPIGPTWVSYDSWGWVTHHYGSWDYVPGYGWVWYPGYRYAPAHVTWYWGPDYVGWCPTGYYSNYYASHGYRGHGLHVGVFGWAGGGWHGFSHWSFTATLHFGKRHHHREIASGLELAKRRVPSLGRGIVTTELGRVDKDPHRVFASLKEKVERERRTHGRELPDVSDFVARKPLRGEVSERVLARKPATVASSGEGVRPFERRVERSSAERRELWAKRRASGAERTRESARPTDIRTRVERTSERPSERPAVTPRPQVRPTEKPAQRPREDAERDDDRQRGRSWGSSRAEEERGRIERERAEAERGRVERERIEAERRRESERSRAEAERIERQRTEQARAEQVRAERTERERIERQRAERERVERQRAEQARVERERAERQRAEQVRVERERAERQQAEAERAETARAERERAERARAEQVRAERERAERQRAEAERAERERVERQRNERQRTEKKRPERKPRHRDQ